MIIDNKNTNKIKALRLLDKSRRSFLRGIFSRTTVISILLILQLLFIIASFVWVDHYRIWVVIIERALAIATVLYLVNSEMDALSRVTWLILVMIAPLLGSLFLIYTKLDWGYRGLKLRMNHLVDASSQYLQDNLETLRVLKSNTSTTYHLVQYFDRSHGDFPAYQNTEVTYFPTGEEFFEELKKQLLKAEDYIFMEFFIIAEGKMWGEILRILEQKVREGVEVRVLYDGMIEFSTLSFDYTQRLEKIGIKAKAFSPISPFISTYYNYRDHRKIIVIDGKVGFTGGVNLADEYINKINRFGHWKDSALMLEGEAVDSFLVLFLQMWSITERQMVVKPYLAKHDKKRKANGYVIPYGDSPLDTDKIGENVYIDILNHAREYVYIMTPYLILDSEMEHALCFAAERGVDVQTASLHHVKITAVNAFYHSDVARRFLVKLLNQSIGLFKIGNGNARQFLPGDCQILVNDHGQRINRSYTGFFQKFPGNVQTVQLSIFFNVAEDIGNLQRRSQAG